MTKYNKKWYNEVNAFFIIKKLFNCTQFNCTQFNFKKNLKLGLDKDLKKWYNGVGDLFLYKKII